MRSLAARLQPLRPFATAAAAVLPAVVASAAATAPLLLLAPSVALAARHTASPGDVLQLFHRQIVYVVTDADPAVADALLDGCDLKERRVLTIDQWEKMPSGVRTYISPVFLINRERLPDGVRIPDGCQANPDELWTEVRRYGHNGGVTYQVTISAPDGAWLRRGIADFRRLSEAPRSPLRRAVHSVEVVPFGVGATAAASAVAQLVDSGDRVSDDYAAHVVSPADWRAFRSAGRCEAMDEVLLVDRSTAAVGDVPASPAGLAVGAGDTVAWRERKSVGYERIVYSGPTGSALEDWLRRPGDPFSVPEAPTVLATARDLRAVRRVVVAGLKNGTGGPDLAKRLASVTATDLRSLGAFDVLERAGMNEVLGEVALNQAGITHAPDRVKLQQLSAADALLIVEITDASGRTEYSSKSVRLTEPIGPPPRRPAEPMRLRYDIVIPGKENDPLVRGITEAVLEPAVGIKSEREYRREINEYNEVTLPRWQSEVDAYNQARRMRQIHWRQRITATSVATVRGSLRLIDLTDGSVLWEGPFSSSVSQASPPQTCDALTCGEDSAEPGVPKDLQGGDQQVSEDLIVRAAESGVESGIQSLAGAALLPQDVQAVPRPATGDVVQPPQPPTGHLLDIDGSLLLVGLGAEDGLKLGDSLTVTLDDGEKVHATVTRVRPRTCDALFDASVTPAQKALVAVGQAVTR